MDAGKPLKRKLDPKIIADIIHYVTKRCNVTETAVRSSITTKCADENKMLRQRKSKAIAKQEALGLLQDLSHLESLEISDNLNNSHNSHNSHNSPKLPHSAKPKHSQSSKNAQNSASSDQINDENLQEHGARLEDNKENVKNSIDMNMTSPKYGKKKAMQRTFGLVQVVSQPTK